LWIDCAVGRGLCILWLLPPFRIPLALPPSRLDPRGGAGSWGCRRAPPPDRLRRPTSGCVTLFRRPLPLSCAGNTPKLKGESVERRNTGSFAGVSPPSCADAAPLRDEKIFATSGMGRMAPHLSPADVRMWVGPPPFPLSSLVGGAVPPPPLCDGVSPIPVPPPPSGRSSRSSTTRTGTPTAPRATSRPSTPPTRVPPTDASIPVEGAGSVSGRMPVSSDHRVPLTCRVAIVVVVVPSQPWTADKNLPLKWTSIVRPWWMEERGVGLPPPHLGSRKALHRAHGILRVEPSTAIVVWVQWASAFFSPAGGWTLSPVDP